MAQVINNQIRTQGEGRSIAVRVRRAGMMRASLRSLRLSPPTQQPTKNDDADHEPSNDNERRRGMKTRTTERKMREDKGH